MCVFNFFIAKKEKNIDGKIRIFKLYLFCKFGFKYVESCCISLYDRCQFLWRNPLMITTSVEPPFRQQWQQNVNINKWFLPENLQNDVENLEHFITSIFNVVYHIVGYLILSSLVMKLGRVSFMRNFQINCVIY